MLDLDTLFLAALLRDKDVTMLTSVQPETLIEPYRKQFEWVKVHYTQYGYFPSKELFEAGTTVILPEAPDALAFYADQIRERHRRVFLADLCHQIETDLKEDRVDAAEAHVARGALDMAGHTISAGFDASKTQDERNKRYTDRANGVGVFGLPTPWPWLTDKTTGLQAGQFWIFAARPKCGKTWNAVLFSKAIWFTGKPVLFVSMELPRSVITDRLDALGAAVPYRSFKRGQLIPQQQDQLRAWVEKTKKAPPFHILTKKEVKTPQDLQIMARALRPAAIILDGLYLMKPAGKTSPALWERVTQLADEIQDGVAELGIPIVTTTQYSREFDRSGKGVPSAEFLGLSDRLGQACDASFGMVIPPTSPNQRIIGITNCREETTGMFLTNWDLAAMDFSFIMEMVKVADRPVPPPQKSRIVALGGEE